MKKTRIFARLLALFLALNCLTLPALAAAENALEDTAAVLEDPAAAEEAAQDAFLALWRGIDRFRQESALSTWIYRLTSNACIDLMRRRRKSEGSVSLDDEALFLDAADPAPQPHEEAERRETQRLLQEGLMSLPAEYRSILLLREIEGLSYSEISETLELELGTVKSRISRGRTLLRNFLSVSGNFFEKSASKVTECNREGMSAK